MSGQRSMSMQRTKPPKEQRRLSWFQRKFGTIPTPAVDDVPSPRSTGSERSGSGDNESDGSEDSRGMRRPPDKMVIDGRWRVDNSRSIGDGVFAALYQASDIKTKELVAVKMESATTDDPQIYYEYDMYRDLAGGVGISKVYFFGSQDGYNLMVMELLGRSLEDYFEMCDCRFSLKTVLMLADQMISRIEYLHSKFYIHRDIKSENFLMGRGRSAKDVYVIDYGLSDQWCDPKTKRHIKKREGRELIGTARFVSINTHLGIEKSRRDDVEELGYVFIYFLKGRLPWQGLRGSKDSSTDLYAKIRDKKLSISINELCNGIPVEFATYLKYCRNLEFEQQPDYAYLRNLFRSLFKKQSYKWDYKWDWLKFL